MQEAGERGRIDFGEDNLDIVGRAAATSWVTFNNPPTAMHAVVEMMQMMRAKDEYYLISVHTSDGPVCPANLEFPHWHYCSKSNSRSLRRRPVRQRQHDGTVKKMEGSTSSTLSGNGASITRTKRSIEDRFAHYRPTQTHRREGSERINSPHQSPLEGRNL